VSPPELEVIKMMWGYGWGWGSWLGMGVGMILFWALVIVAIIALAGDLRRSRDASQSTSTGGLERPEELLAERFARGEIDEQEYQRRRELLREGR
jgi:putative membrane protein